MNDKIIYFDTSGDESILKIFEGDKEIAAESWNAKYLLSKTLTSKFLEILEKSGLSRKELEGIVVFIGPGSFTGLRIGISFANGLAFALGIPIYETKTRESFNLENPKEMAKPLYGSEPKITKSKKFYS